MRGLPSQGPFIVGRQPLCRDGEIRRYTSLGRAVGGIVDEVDPEPEPQYASHAIYTSVPHAPRFTHVCFLDGRYARKQV